MLSSGGHLTDLGVWYLGRGGLGVAPFEGREQVSNGAQREPMRDFGMQSNGATMQTLYGLMSNESRWVLLVLWAVFVYTIRM